MSLKGLYFDLVQSQLAGKEDTSEDNTDRNGDDDAFTKDKTNAFKRQMSRQMSRHSNAGITTALSDGEMELQTSRFNLLKRLMKLSIPELPYIIIGKKDFCTYYCIP